MFINIHICVLAHFDMRLFVFLSLSFMGVFRVSSWFLCKVFLTLPASSRTAIFAEHFEMIECVAEDDQDRAYQVERMLRLSRWWLQKSCCSHRGHSVVLMMNVVMHGEYTVQPSLYRADESSYRTLHSCKVSSIILRPSRPLVRVPRSSLAWSKPWR